MRKSAATMILAILLMALLSSVTRAQTLECQEQNFTTEVNFACATEYIEGHGLYIYTVEEGCIPYILVFVNSGEGRSLDGEATLRDKILPGYEESYSPNGSMQMTQYGSFTVGGRSVAAADVVYYNANGLRIYLLTVIDVRESYTAVFRVRYTEPSERQGMLDALDEVAMNLRQIQPTQAAGGIMSGGQGGTGTGPGIGPGTGTGPVPYVINGIEQDGMIFGRCMVPEGYEVKEEVASCTTGQSTSNPYMLRIEAYKPGEAVMTYYSARDFMSNVDGPTEDGSFSIRYMTPMLHYMPAAEYCNYWASQMFPEKILTLVEENTYPEAQAHFRETAQKMYDQQNNALAKALGLSIDGVEITMCTRRYEYEADDVLFNFTVTVPSVGTQMTVTEQGIFTTITSSVILWNIPCMYMVLCPASQWEKVSPVYDMFRENTSASDQFIAANARLAQELWKILADQTSLSYGAGYSEQVMREELSEGEDYSGDRFTDYLFDRNDYTLSDGSHVKVPTSCEYVYEGDNGTVYASDSAFGQPGGSTRLYPNQ